MNLTPATTKFAGGALSTEVPSPVRSIPGELAHLDASVAQLDDALTRLSSRLGPVTSQCPAPAEKDGSPGRSCALAEHIAQVSSRLSLLTKHVEYLNDNVQL